MIKVGIIGVTGFAGSELINILVNHKEVSISYLASRSENGKNISDIYPCLNNVLDKEVEPIEIDKINKLDVVFLALPHTVSFIIAKEISKNVRIIDLSADFRLKNPLEYKKWYKVEHKAPDLLKESVYGLTELHRDRIKNARIVANPGCYATSVILAAAPVFKYVEDIIVDAKSGVSGAGRAVKEGLQFCEVNENFKAYSIKGHRHVAEIQQELIKFKEGYKGSILFVPHLLPIQRGILSTLYIKVKKSLNFTAIYKKFYSNDYFIRICDNPPSLSNVTGTNFCDIYPYFDKSSNRLVVISTIDNLIKGASGQAIQNMNVMFNIDEKEGLNLKPHYP